MIEEKKSSEVGLSFIALISMLMAISSFSIDAMLPALPEISRDLNIINANDRQLIISTIFLGLSFGQIFFGPLSDSLGRKKAIYIGISIFMAGSLICVFSDTFTWFLIGRALQGFGVSAARAISLAIVRDTVEGVAMARIMSYAISVFILMPVVAPLIGQSIIEVSGWRMIFWAIMIYTMAVILWMGLRFEETLHKDKRIRFTITRILSSTKIILRTKVSIGHTITSGLIFGSFMAYLNTAQQIYQEQYLLGDKFPFFFSSTALSIGLASLANANLVTRFGMEKLVRYGIRAVLGLSTLFLIPLFIYHGTPPLEMLMSFLLVTFFFIGLVFSNMNSLAMQPLGEIAGIGSAIVGSISTLLSMFLGAMIGRAYQGTLTPIIFGFVGFSAIAFMVNRWVETS